MISQLEEGGGVVTVESGELDPDIPGDTRPAAQSPNDRPHPVRARIEGRNSFDNHTVRGGIAPRDRGRLNNGLKDIVTTSRFQ